ncbi:MAG: His/Gly/Thr/Pro-type tRNA ligase C-terminal domain-containing protein, partial [Chlamydiales bacterium]
TAFPTSFELKQFTKKYDHYLKKQDHRLLGRELDLFSQVEQLGELEWVWHPKGQCLRSLLQNWVEDQRKDLNAQAVSTPLMIRRSKKQKLNANQFNFFTDEGSYALSSSRLMQHAYLISLQCDVNDSHPIRLIEYGMIYKSQPPEELFGLLSATAALSDQMTVYCQKRQMIKELTSSLLFFEKIIRIFGFEACWYLIASPRKSAKERAEREAVEWLENAVQQSSLFYPFQSERVEEEQLEGPRLEMRIVDGLQREWPGATLQIIVHQDEALGFLQNCPHRLLIAQSVWGSLDRFVALLIERCEGEIPFWLAPEQVRVLVIGKSSQDYAEEVAEKCQQIGIRVKTDRRDVKLSEKVYEARRERIPYLVIIGEQEVKKDYLTLQSVQRPGKSDVLRLDDFLKQLEKERQCPELK